MSASDTVERLVKRNVIIVITGLIYAIPTIMVLTTELKKPNCNYFSVVMTIGLVSIPQGWLQVKELLGVKISIGINKIEDIAIYLILLVFKVVLILALSALLSPLIFVTNLIEFIGNCANISRAKRGGDDWNDAAVQSGGSRKLLLILLVPTLIVGAIFAYNALKRSRKAADAAKAPVAVTKQPTAPAAETGKTTVSTPIRQKTAAAADPAPDEDDRITSKAPTAGDTRAESADPKSAPAAAASDTTPGFTPGIFVKSWSGWHSRNWSPTFFERGGHKSASLVRSEKIGIFDPSSFDEDGRSYGKMTMAYKGYFHIRTSGTYTFRIMHPSVPANWSCGSYAVYVDGKKLIGVINRKYSPRNNDEKRVRIRLNRGYHLFILINEVNWRCPAASHIEIEYVAPTHATTALSNANAFLQSEKDAQDR